MPSRSTYDSTQADRTAAPYSNRRWFFQRWARSISDWWYSLFTSRSQENATLLGSSQNQTPSIATASPRPGLFQRIFSYFSSFFARSHTANTNEAQQTNFDNTDISNSDASEENQEHPDDFDDIGAEMNEVNPEYPDDARISSPAMIEEKPEYPDGPSIDAPYIAEMKEEKQEHPYSADIEQMYRIFHEAFPDLRSETFRIYIEAQIECRLHKFNMQHSPALNATLNTAKERCFGPNVTLEIPLARSEAILASIVRAKKIEFILAFYKEEALEDGQSIELLKLNALFNASLSTSIKVDRFNKKLNYVLCEKSKLGADFSLTLEHQAKPKSFDFNKSEFVLRVNDLAMGYTVYNFLSYQLGRRQPNGHFIPYNGDTVFSLTFKEFEKIDGYFAELHKWFEDFENIMSTLLGPDVENYTLTGQKSLSEVLRAERDKEQYARPPLIQSSTLEQLSQYNPNQKVLLVGQLTLDLTQHPNKEQMRDLLESWYKKHNFKDNAGRDKTFIKQKVMHGGLEEEIHTFTTMLSISNIQAIFPELMAQSHLTSLAQEMQCSSAVDPMFLEFLDCSDVQQAFKKLLHARLTELPVTTPSQKREVQREVDRFLQQREEKMDDLASLKQRYNEAITKLLNTVSGSCVPFPSEDRPRLTQEEHYLLFSSPNRYEDMHRDLHAIRHQPVFAEARKVTRDDIDTLFHVLRSSEAYRAAIMRFELNREAYGLEESLDHYLEKLKNTFIDRSRQHRDEPDNDEGFYGRAPLLQAFLFLENFVSKFVYQQKLQILESSLDAALLYLAGETTEQALNSSCERGLGGKMYKADAMAQGELNDILEQIITQLKRECSDKTMREVAPGLHRDHEADIEVFKKSIDYKLGIATENGRLVHAELEQRFFPRFASYYTPASIYKACYNKLFDSFRTLVRDKEDDELYKLVHFLEIGDDSEPSVPQKITIDRLYKLNGKGGWSLSNIETQLPQLLITILSKRGHFSVQPNTLTLQWKDGGVNQQQGYRPSLALESKDEPAAPPSAAQLGLFGNGHNNPVVAVSFSSLPEESLEDTSAA